MDQKRRPCVYLSAIVAVFVLLCTIQALYWPIIMKPGTHLYWWQVKWLSDIGIWLGLPVLASTLFVGGRVLLFVTAVWSAIIFFIAKLICQRVHLFCRFLNRSHNG